MVNGIQSTTLTTKIDEVSVQGDIAEEVHFKNKNKRTLKPQPESTWHLDFASELSGERSNDVSLNVKMEFHKKTDKPLIERFAKKIAKQIAKITRSHEDYENVTTAVVNRLLKKHDIFYPVTLKDRQRIYTEDKDVIEIISRTPGMGLWDEEMYTICVQELKDAQDLEEAGEADVDEIAELYYSFGNERCDY